MMWLCWFKHKWDKWGQPQWRETVSKTTGNHRERMIQDRSCQRCGEYDWKLV